MLMMRLKIMVLRLVMFLIKFATFMHFSQLKFYSILVFTALANREFSYENKIPLVITFTVLMALKIAIN